MSQTGGITAERWATYPFEQQVLMIANEMNRAGKLAGPGDDSRRRNAYARILHLTDLTIATTTWRGARRELLRWRDLAASLFVAPSHQSTAHAAAFRCLLLFTPASARQIPFVLGPRA